MSDLMKVIQEADGVSLDMERAKEAVESAKAALETAKASFDQARERLEQMFTQADSLGISRSKLKKLIEDRTAAILASGLLPAGANGASPERAPKPPRAAKAGKKAKAGAEAGGEQASGDTEAFMEGVDPSRVPERGSEASN